MTPNHCVKDECCTKELSRGMLLQTHTPFGLKDKPKKRRKGWGRSQKTFGKFETMKNLQIEWPAEFENLLSFWWENYPGKKRKRTRLVLRSLLRFSGFFLLSFPLVFVGVAKMKLPKSVEWIFVLFASKKMRIARAPQDFLEVPARLPVRRRLWCGHCDECW